MSIQFKKFLLHLLLFSLAILVVEALVFNTLLIEHYQSVYFLSLIFFVILTIGIHAFLLSIANQSIAKFSKNFMILTFLKIFVCMIFLAIYLFANKENAVKFTLVFFVQYMLYTIFEVILIVPNVKKNNKNSH